MEWQLGKLWGDVEEQGKVIHVVWKHVWGREMAYIRGF